MMDLPVFFDYAASCAPHVEAVILAKIAKQESALRPWALSVNYPNGTAAKMGEPGGYARLARQPRTKEQAIRWAALLLKDGHTVSFGLMQISSQNLARLGYTLEQAYDPCTNIKIAGDLLAQKLASAKAIQPDDPLPVALSLYNSGHPRMGFSNGYVSGVLGQRVHFPAAHAAVREKRTANVPSLQLTQGGAKTFASVKVRAVHARANISYRAALSAPTSITWKKPLTDTMHSGF